MTVRYPPFVPQFGSGPPSPSVPMQSPYYDTSTNPFTPYVANAGVWKKAGAIVGGGNVTSIQGVAVSATAPTGTQKLTFNGTQWAPA